MNIDVAEHVCCDSVQHVCCVNMGLAWMQYGHRKDWACMLLAWMGAWLGMSCVACVEIPLFAASNFWFPDKELNLFLVLLSSAAALATAFLFSVVSFILLNASAFL